MKALEYLFSDIEVGQGASFSRTWTEDDVVVFAELSGDNNPLHVDDVYAATTRFGKRLVHGMLVGSMCSALVGMYLPGKKCLYLSQNLVFKKPVYIGDTTIIFGNIIAKSEATRILTVAILIKKDGSIVLEGEALVQIL